MNRNKQIDIIKGLLIFLVVLGHFVWEFHKYSPVGVSIYDSIYNVILSFHMPAFIFLSGYLSKHIDSQRENELYLLYPFICFQIVNIVFTYLTGYGRGNRDFFTPIYQNWYILALFYWRTFLPYSAKMRKEVAISIALCLGLSIGFISPNIGKVLALHRSFYFYPFFLAGFYVNDLSSIIKWVHLKERKRLVAMLFFVSLITIFMLSWRVGLSNIIHIGFAPTIGYPGNVKILLVRITCLAVSFLLILALFTCLYDFRLPFFWGNRFVRFGEHTMPIYLVHSFFIYIIVPSILLKVSFIWALLLSVLCSWIICLLLSNSKVISVFKYLGDGKFVSEKISYSIFK